MSTQANPTRPALPPAAVDRVFERLLAIFGAQRMTAAWGDVPADERRAAWGGAIAKAVWSHSTRRYDLASIGDALDDLAAQPTSWPPSSGEFADRCERFAQRPGRNMLALPVPKRTEADLAAGREQMARIKAMLGRVGRSSREPGSDDESPAPPAACTCFVGLVRSETLCPSCATYARNRSAQSMRRDGTAQSMADDDLRAA